MFAGPTGEQLLQQRVKEDEHVLSLAKRKRLEASTTRRALAASDVTAAVPNSQPPYWHDHIPQSHQRRHSYGTRTRKTPTVSILTQSSMLHATFSKLQQSLSLTSPLLHTPERAALPFGTHSPNAHTRPPPISSGLGADSQGLRPSSTHFTHWSSLTITTPLAWASYGHAHISEKEGMVHYRHHESAHAGGSTGLIADVLMVVSTRKRSVWSQSLVTYLLMML